MIHESRLGWPSTSAAKIPITVFLHQVNIEGRCPLQYDTLETLKQPERATSLDQIGGINAQRSLMVAHHPQAVFQDDFCVTHCTRVLAVHADTQSTGLRQMRSVKRAQPL